jgi:hypothetical protein
MSAFLLAVIVRLIVACLLSVTIHVDTQPAIVAGQMQGADGRAVPHANVRLADTTGGTVTNAS